MSTAETKLLIEQAVRNFQKEVPALQQLKLVIELELRGRGDIQLFRVEVPGPKVTRDIASDAKVRLSVPALALQRAGRRGQGAQLARGVRDRHREGERAAGDPQAHPERRGEAGGAQPHAQAEVVLTPRMPAGVGRRTSARSCAGRRGSRCGGSASRRRRPTTPRWPTRSPRSSRSSWRPTRATAAEARRRCGSGVEVGRAAARRLVGARLGPDLRAGDGDERAGVQFGFNGWGGKFAPYRRRRRLRHARAGAPGRSEARRDPPDPRGGLDHRRRRGHADHDRAVPVPPSGATRRSRARRSRRSCARSSAPSA